MTGDLGTDGCQDDVCCMRNVNGRWFVKERCFNGGEAGDIWRIREKKSWNGS